MAEPSWPQAVDRAAYIEDVAAVQQKFRLPPPVIVLAADLLQRVPRRVAVRNASELVSALLVNGLRTADELAEIIGEYRETRVYAILDPSGPEGMYPMPSRSEVDLG